MATALTHDELAHDLAAHLKGPARLVWCDMQMGPSGSARPDVFTMEKSFVRPIPTAYECKISVSDFRADVTVGKWQSYLEFATAVTFCVPSGLVSRDDIPKGCGFMTRGDKGWVTIRKPTRQAVRLKTDHLLKLLIDGWGRELSQIEAKHKHAYEIRTDRKVRKKFGNEVANVIRDMSGAKRMVEYYENRQRDTRERMDKEHSESIARNSERINALWTDIRRALNLAPEASSFDVEREIRRLRSGEPAAVHANLIRVLRDISGISSRAVNDASIQPRTEPAQPEVLA